MNTSAPSQDDSLATSTATSREIAGLSALRDGSLDDSPAVSSRGERWPVVLVRYGRIPEIARFGLPEGVARVERGECVVIQSPRGLVIGSVLEQLRRDPNPDEMGEQRESPSTTGTVERIATSDDVAKAAEADRAAADGFGDWYARIADWGIDVELLDVELTLDGRTTLFVLNSRGAEPTKLALRAVTEHLGLIDVQPVTADGVVPPQGGGGCGSCGTH